MCGSLSVDGHLAAFAFVTKIGPCNLGFIKSTTPALPIESYDKGKYGENWNPSSWRRINEVYNRMPFPYSPKPWLYRKQYKRLAYGDAWCHLAWKLTTAQRLTNITFVLPDITEFSRGLRSKYHKAISALDDLCTAKPFLKLQIVRLAHEGDILCAMHAAWIAHLVSFGTSCVHTVTHQLDGRWALLGQPYVNKHGGFADFEDLN